MHNGVPLMIVPVGVDDEAVFEPADEVDVATIGIGNNWLVRNHFPRANMCADGHRHLHDHLMIVSCGAIEICANGLRSRYGADHVIVIPKQTRHQVRSLQDGTSVWCVAALRDGETGEVIGPDDHPLQFEPLTQELATALGDLNALLDPAAKAA